MKECTFLGLATSDQSFEHRWKVEFPVPLLTLFKLQSYLVHFISARIFITPKLQNIHSRQFFYRELFSLCIVLLLNVILLNPPPPLVFTITSVIPTGLGALGDSGPGVWKITFFGSRLQSPVDDYSTGHQSSGLNRIRPYPPTGRSGTCRNPGTHYLLQGPLKVDRGP